MAGKTQREGLQLDLSGLTALKNPTQMKNVTLKGVKAGAKLVQEAEKARAPKQSGALKQAIGIKSQKGTRGKTAAYAIIGARVKVRKQVRRGRSKKKTLAVPAKYLHLVDQGTKYIRGRRFAQAAFGATKQQAIAAAGKVIGAEVQRLVAKEAAKLASKG